MEAVKLRGHHLVNIAYLYEDSRFAFSEKMKMRGYVDSAEHPFIALTYDKIRELFGNPQQRFLVVADEIDFICEACPKLAAGNCRPTTKEQREVIGDAFLHESERDDAALRMLGFKANQNYTAEEIRNRMGF